MPSIHPLRTRSQSLPAPPDRAEPPRPRAQSTPLPPLTTGRVKAPPRVTPPTPGAAPASTRSLDSKAPPALEGPTIETLEIPVQKGAECMINACFWAERLDKNLAPAPGLYERTLKDARQWLEKKGFASSWADEEHTRALLNYFDADLAQRIVVLATPDALDGHAKGYDFGEDHLIEAAIERFARGEAIAMIVHDDAGAQARTGPRDKPAPVPVHRFCGHIFALRIKGDRIHIADSLPNRNDRDRAVATALWQALRRDPDEIARTRAAFGIHGALQACTNTLSKGELCSLEGLSSEGLGFYAADYEHEKQILSSMAVVVEAFEKSLGRYEGAFNPEHRAPALTLKEIVTLERALSRLDAEALSSLRYRFADFKDCPITAYRQRLARTANDVLGVRCLQLKQALIPPVLNPFPTQAPKTWEDNNGVKRLSLGLPPDAERIFGGVTFDGAQEKTDRVIVSALARTQSENSLKAFGALYALELGTGKGVFAKNRLHRFLSKVAAGLTLPTAAACDFDPHATIALAFWAARAKSPIANRPEVLRPFVPPKHRRLYAAATDIMRLLDARSLDLAKLYFENLPLERFTTMVQVARDMRHTIFDRSTAQAFADVLDNLEPNLYRQKQFNSLRQAFRDVTRRS